jgi:hypothetical protein
VEKLFLKWHLCVCAPHWHLDGWAGFSCPDLRVYPSRSVPSEYEHSSIKKMRYSQKWLQ